MRDVIAQALSAKGRGSQTRLADAVGVRAQTVNKWVKGANAPDMESWPAIERFLELEPGTLARAAGIRPLGDDDEGLSTLQNEIEQLGVELRNLADRVRLLEQRDAR